MTDARSTAYATSSSSSIFYVRRIAIPGHPDTGPDPRPLPKLGGNISRRDPIPGKPLRITPGRVWHAFTSSGKASCRRGSRVPPRTPGKLMPSLLPQARLGAPGSASNETPQGTSSAGSYYREHTHTHTYIESMDISVEHAQQSMPCYSLHVWWCIPGTCPAVRAKAIGH